VQLQHIEATPTAKGHTFVAVLADGEETIRVPVDTPALVRYVLFIDTVLTATGRLFMYHGCEGRRSEESDFWWRLYVQPLIHTVQPAKTPADLN